MVSYAQIDLRGKWELSYDTKLSGIVDPPIVSPYHRLKFGPAQAITAFTFVSPKDKEYAGEYDPATSHLRNRAHL